VKGKPFGILIHAVKMVRRNIRSYALLSVTIILSFSFLLGFLGYMDTAHYNQYKNLFTRDPSLLKVSSSKLNTSITNRIQERAREYGTTHTLQYLKYNCNVDTSQWVLPTGERLWFLHATAYGIPRECWYLEREKSVLTTGISLNEPYPVTWLDNREANNITLENGQVLMDEQLFKALGLTAENNILQLQLTHSYASSTGDMTHISGSFTVVGTVPSNTHMELERRTVESTEETYVTPANSAYEATLVFSLDDLNPTTLPGSYIRTVIFHTDQPENIEKMIESLEPDLPITSIYTLQKNAQEKIRTEKSTKAIITALLMLILGINLYSSFENTLNDRKFEIGVKRAMGASGFSIIRQFFYESMLVMIANIAISVALVVDLGIVWKLFCEANYIQEVSENATRINYQYYNYILYITPYSIGMFAACAIVLTVVFSFVFAYKTTQVQIVDYLKTE